MNTPVADFVRAYAGSGVSRLHMPGHKGQPFLGCEALDITEVQGADALFEALKPAVPSAQRVGTVQPYTGGARIYLK